MKKLLNVVLFGCFFILLQFSLNGQSLRDPSTLSPCDPCIYVLPFDTVQTTTKSISITSSCYVEVTFKARKCAQCTDLKIISMKFIGNCPLNNSGQYCIDEEYVLGMMLENMNLADTLGRGYNKCLRLIRPKCWKKLCPNDFNNGGGPQGPSMGCNEDCCVSRIAMTGDGFDCYGMYDAPVSTDIDMNIARNSGNTSFEWQYDNNNPCPITTVTCPCEKDKTCSSDFVKKYLRKKSGIDRINPCGE